MDRRKFIRLGALMGVGALSRPAAAAERAPTPPEAEGPFYPLRAQADKDFDLTRIEGHTQRAAGEVIIIDGRVLDIAGKPIEGVSVEIWQANTHGRYRHPHDSNPAPIDEHFQGWAIVPSGQQGSFRFKTIFPGAYPASRNWTRPPHIHYKVAKRGYEDLTTQMYFPDQPLNEKDRLLQRKSPQAQRRMIAEERGRSEQGHRIFAYTIVLEAP